MQPLIDAGKVCRGCDEKKPLSAFHPNKQCKLGVVGTCRDCTGKRIAGWYSDNRKRRQEVANKRNQERKQNLVDYFGAECFDCKQKYPNCVYQFHHLDPSKKDMNPSQALTMKENSMWEELRKCVMLCANCHMIRHHCRKEGVDATTH